MNKLQLTIISAFILLCTNIIFGQVDSSGTLKIEIKNDTSSGIIGSTETSMQIDLNNNFWAYPEAAIKNNIQGNVYFTLTLGTRCTIDSVLIDKGLGYGLDEIAVSILKNLHVVIFQDNKRIQDCTILEKANPLKGRKVSAYLKFQFK